MTASRSSDAKPLLNASTWANLRQSLVIGTVTTVAAAPLINPFYCASIVAARYNLTGMNLVNGIYSGAYNEKRRNVPGYGNFLAGMREHIGKELIRSNIKAPALGIYLPWLQMRYSADQAIHLYAATMSTIEAFINPIDTLKTAKQSGDKAKKTFRYLYRGAFLNGIRQEVTWLAVGYNNKWWDPFLQDHGINPYGATGILIKVYPQAASITACAYWLERIKNERQFPTQTEQASVVSTVRDIYKKQGMVGFYRGYWWKTPGASIQHLIALSVIGWGKRRAAEENQKTNSSSLSTVQPKSLTLSGTKS